MAKSSSPRITQVAIALVAVACAAGGYSVMTGSSSDPGLPYTSDLGEAKSKAHQRNTGVLVEFKTINCMYCTMMDREVLSQSDVKKIMGKFEYVRLMWPQANEVAEQYSIESFPTYVVIDSKGTEIARASGFTKRDLFKVFLQGALMRVSGAGV